MSANPAEPAAAAPAAEAHRVSLFHLNGLRILYFLIACFLLSSVAPLLAEPPPTMMTGAARALFVALGLLALLGIRYPLQMLPIMLFEFTWKALWLAFIGLPMWAAGELDPANSETFVNVVVGAPLVLIVMPWRHLFEVYMKRPGDRWRGPARSSR
ncbi:MAG TPA: hypothetical protein VN231_03920 [Allosphingosinicella sp.]|nr:hypothetical protein [Allosphingosinicella sp.]